MKGVFLILFTAVSCQATYNCPVNTIQLIDSSDVDLSNSNSSDELVQLIEVSPLFNYWNNYTVPYYVGNLTFKKHFVIVGLTIHGDHFVSNFTLRWSEDNGSLPMDFIVHSRNKKSFIFRSPIMVKTLVVIVNEVALLGYNIIYYWRLNLIGCPLENATLANNNINQGGNNSCREELTAAIVLPLLLLFVIVTIVIVTTVVLVVYKCKANKYEVVNVVSRQNTLKELSNVGIYGDEPSKPSNDEMVYNAAYIASYSTSQTAFTTSDTHLLQSMQNSSTIVEEQEQEPTYEFPANEDDENQPNYERVVDNPLY
jgi:hypothetical protein